jgi:hypothetical protein
MAPDRQAPGIRLPAKLFLVAWMVAAVMLFVVVSLSPEGPVAAAAPRFLLQAREWLLPFFHAAALY